MIWNVIVHVQAEDMILYRDAGKNFRVTQLSLTAIIFAKTNCFVPFPVRN